MEKGFVKVADLKDIAEADGKVVAIDGSAILICHTSKGVFAVENKCSHQTAELYGGKIRSCFIFCPLHGQRFDLRDGKPIGKLTDKPIKTYAVKIDGDDIWVNPMDPACDSQD